MIRYNHYERIFSKPEGLGMFGKPSSRVLRICSNEECKREVWVFPSKATYFKYCCSECRNAVHKKTFVPPKKGKAKPRIIKKCTNPFCNKTKIMSPIMATRKAARKLNPFCSQDCMHYYYSKVYRDRVLKLKEGIEETNKRNIWFVGTQETQTLNNYPIPKINKKKKGKRRLRQEAEELKLLAEKNLLNLETKIEEKNKEGTSNVENDWIEVPKKLSPADIMKQIWLLNKR